jgi:hypothetical protein
MKRIIFILSFLFTSLAQAHQLSTAYFQAGINNTGVLQGELQVRLYDLEQALALDEDGNGKLIWGELQAREADVSLYLNNHLNISRGDKACTLVLPTPWQIDSHFNEGYLVLPVRAQCALAGVVKINYTAFFNDDSQHKLLINFKQDENTSSTESRVISATQPDITFNAESGNRWISFREFVYQGMTHIWQGTDHILFLFSLLLTCVLTRRTNRWVGKKNIRDIIIHTTWIVTAFTLAHSITLTATALNILHFPSRWIESGIALSVAFAAINNIFPMVLRMGILTFCFGLLHGMGFAGALGELGIPADQQLLTVLAFNIGVEIGQMAIVLVVLPILITVRNKIWYSRYSLIAISVVIALVAIQWVFQRIAG